MALEHKAFLFDYEGFNQQLGNLLLTALVTHDPAPLRDFIAANVDELKDPYEGEPLDSSWEEMIEPKDEHQYGDYALTKFYDSQADLGLGPDWEEVEELLDEAASGGSAIVLGVPFGPPDNYFDPGKTGAYFQSPDLVKNNLQVLENLVGQKPDLQSKLGELIELLEQAAEEERGLYITF